MQADQCDIPRPSKRVRLAISRGTAFPEGVDGRSASSRRFRDLQIAFATDIAGSGDLGALGEADRALVRNASLLTIKLEELNGQVLRGEAVDEESMIRLSNALNRTLGALKRKQNGPATPPQRSLKERLVAQERGAVA